MELRRCCTCKVEKSTSDFYTAGKRKNYVCKTCSNAKRREWGIANRERLLQYRRERYAENPERFRGPARKEAIARWHKKTPDEKRAVGLWRFHQMPLDEYKTMVDAQHGRCALCHGDGGKRGLFVDHCHTSGKVRALLCVQCNAAVGWMENDVERFARTLEFLRAHDSPALPD